MRAREKASTFYIQDDEIDAELAGATLAGAAGCDRAKRLSRCAAESLR